MTSADVTERPVLLIVDDDPQLRGLAAMILGSPTRELVLAEEVESAMAAVRARPIRVIIADYQMPGKSGLDFYLQVREEGFTMPFILMSGDAHAKTAVAARSEGMYAVLTKPVSPTQLRRLVDDALAGKDPA